MVKRFRQSGFTLIELLMVVALVGIVSVIGLPLLGRVSGAIALGEAARQVERELQSARMTAVSANHPVRVMFNCPIAGQVQDGRAHRNAGSAGGGDGVVGRCSDIDLPVSCAGQQSDYPSEHRRSVAQARRGRDVYDVDNDRVLARWIGAHEHRGHQPLAAHCSARNEHHPDAKRQNKINFGERHWQNPTCPVNPKPGFSIVEVLVATGLLATALVALAQLFAIATTTNAHARSSTITMILAEQKIEQLRGLQYTFDRAGLPVQDTETDLAVYPPLATGGKGLSPHTDNTLQANTDGYVDYLDHYGRTLGGGTVIPEEHGVYPPVVGRAAPDQSQQRDHSSGARDAAPRSRHWRYRQRVSRAGRGPSHDD